MNAQKILPACFVDALNTMNGLHMYIACAEGRLCYHGKILNVSDNWINILENGVEHAIHMKNVCFAVMYDEAGKFPTPMESTNSVLFERFQSFLNKKIELTKVNGSIWAIGGRLEYIEDDYLVMRELSEKSITYINATENFDIKTLRVLDC